MFNLKQRPHYFSYHLNREVSEIYWHSFLHGLALSLVLIFEPIYLYSLGFGLVKIMQFYAEVYILYIIFVSFGAKFASRFGYKHSIFVSNIFYVIYWVVLFSVKSHPALFWLAPLFFALQKSWFWPAYDADVALNAVKKQRGREVGALFSLIQVSFILGPLLGGLISAQFGFLALFISAAALMILSTYPLFTSREIYSSHSFQLARLWQIFKKYRVNFFGYWGYAEDLMLMSLWPIYMFIVIPDYFKLGAISTIATLVGTVLMLYIGRLADRREKRKILSWASVVYAVTWVFRFLVRDLGSVVAFDALTKANKDAVDVPLVSLTFENAAQGDSDHAIAYSVFYEMSLSVGKILTALAAILILANTGNIFLVFALVGVMTMLYGLLK